MVTFKFKSAEMLLLAAKAALVEARGKDPEATLLVGDDPEHGLRGFVLYAKLGPDRDLTLCFAWEVSKALSEDVSPAVKTFVRGDLRDRVLLGAKLHETTVIMDFLGALPETDEDYFTTGAYRNRVGSA